MKQHHLHHLNLAKTELLVITANMLVNHNITAQLVSTTLTPTAVHLVFNQPDWTHVTLLLISLHWLPVGTRIKFKVSMVAFRTAPQCTTTIECSLPPAAVIEQATCFLLHNEAQIHFPYPSLSLFLSSGWSCHPPPKLQLPSQQSRNMIFVT